MVIITFDLYEISNPRANTGLATASKTRSSNVRMKTNLKYLQGSALCFIH